VLQCGNYFTASDLDQEADDSHSAQGYYSDVMDGCSLDSATPNSESGEVDDGDSDLMADHDSDSVTSCDSDAVDDGDPEEEYGVDPDAVADDGPEVATGSNSKVRCDGGSDGSDAEAGSDSDAVSRELLRRWLECGNFDAAGGL
jgi:hypothetical protein